MEASFRAKSHGGVDYEEQNIIRVEPLGNPQSETPSQTEESSVKVRNDGSVQVAMYNKTGQQVVD